MFHDLDKTLENMLKDAAAPAELVAAGVAGKECQAPFIRVILHLFSSPPGNE